MGTNQLRRLLSKSLCGRIIEKTSEKSDAVLVVCTKFTSFTFELVLQAGASGFTATSRALETGFKNLLDSTSSSFNSVVSIREKLKRISVT